MLTKFEKEVEALASRVLGEYERTLGDLELRAESAGIKVLEGPPGRRTSELEITFYRGNEFADIFEFFVEKDGAPHVTLDDIESWLRTELAELPLRHSI